MASEVNSLGSTGAPRASKAASITANPSEKMLTRHATDLASGTRPAPNAAPTRV
ncbi:Uncharacterised protein [Mycobacteroides abscessus subsp. abscessus]|nr:Uncharacterised protein [Mycobacteroides abscessus subsp. abscessus]